MVMTDTNPELENQSMGTESSSSQDQDSRSQQGTEPKKKLKNLRSHKLSKPSTRRAKSQSDHPPVDTSNAGFQASSPDSESSINSKEQRRKNLNTSKSNSSSPGLKSARILTRTTTLKPVRILSKIRKASKVPPIPMSSAERATCSSTIKGSKIPDSVEHEHEHGESDSKILPVMKVCPYTYCSLHGHRHAPAVPLKQYMSKKRRSMKGQKSTKSKSLSPLEGKHSRDGKEGIHENQRVSTGNSENQKTASNNHGGITSKGENIEMDGLTGVTGGLSDTCKSTASDAPVESLALKSVLSSDSVDDTLEGQIAANEEKNEDSKPDGRCLQGLPPLEDSDPNCTSDALQETQMEKRKYIRMWHLIHQSVVSSTATKSGTPLHVNGAGAEQQVGNANKLLWGKSYDSYQGFSKTSQDIDMKGNDEGRQKMELCQNDAVKLVQEAIDGILLPETGDYSSDDKSINGDIDSEQGPLERNQAEGGDRSIFTPTDSAKGSRSSPDIIWPRADSNITQEEEKTVPKVESKFNQKIPSRWSNLKKIILFKRFIKALEKVSTFNPHEPRYLPLEPNPEAEKISLRRQTVEERKSAEEWMLDYALRQVVAKLTPARKKRVQLIVEAFETVIPLSENGTNPGQNALVCTHTNQITDRIDSTVQNGEGTVKGNLVETLVGKTSYPETSPVMSELKETSPECWRVKTEVDKPVVQAFDKVGKEEEIDEAILGNGEDKSPFTGQLSAVIKSTSQDDFEGSTSINSLALSASVCREGQFATSKKNTIDSEPDNGLPQTSPPPEDSEPDNESHVAYKIQMEKQKYMEMWHMIYHHVVSGRAAKVGSQLHLNGANKEEEVEDANTLHGDISGSYQDLSETDKDMVQKSHNAENQKMEISQIDAIKLVEEAIDEVLLPENQDQSSDDQSIASDVTSEQDISETNHDEDVELKISTSSADTIKEFKKINVENGKVFVSEKKGLKVGDITRLQQEKTEPKVGRKPNQHMSKRWSNLKKVILLKRFIKALDKVKKFNPRKPQYLPLEPDPEAERIDLKHQTLEERKSAEEWMLDYALQQVVTKLTPARKRRVELLVEAFQTVVPQSGIETHLQHNSAISPHRKPIQARDWLLR